MSKLKNKRTFLNVSIFSFIMGFIFYITTVNSNIILASLVLVSNSLSALICYCTYCILKNMEIYHKENQNEK